MGLDRWLPSRELMALKGGSVSTWWFCLDQNGHTDLHVKKLSQLNEEVFPFLFLLFQEVKLLKVSVLHLCQFFDKAIKGVPMEEN